MTTQQDYGVNMIIGDTAGQPPISVASEIPAIFGAFPCDKEVDPDYGKPLQWYRLLSWSDYKSKYGAEAFWGDGNLERSDGWNATKTIERLTKGFGMYPILIFNVLDPAEDVQLVGDENITFSAGNLTQPVANKYGLIDTFLIEDIPGLITYIEGVDYSLELVEGVVEITRIATGDIGETDTVLAHYKRCSPSSITDASVQAAIEKTDDIILDYGFANWPGWLHAPLWSQKDTNLITIGTTRSALSTAAGSLNSVVTTRWCYDLEETEYLINDDIQDLIDEKTVLDENARAFGAAGTMTTGETEQLVSDWYIGMMAEEVSNNGYPSVTPSNRPMLNYVPDRKLTYPTESNAIRDKGIITVCLDPGDRGWCLWGTKTAYFNGTSTDLAKDSTNQNDLINYLYKLIVRDVWVKNTDRNFNKITLNDFLDKWNSLGKLKVGQGKLLGFQLSFLEEDNPTPSEYLKFRLRVLGPEPAARTDIELNVDLAYFDTLFG